MLHLQDNMLQLHLQPTQLVVNAQRPATMQSAVQNAPVIPILGAPEVPGSRPRTAPAGTSDPRPAPEKSVLDVIEALSSSAKGAEVLKRMRGTFGTRRLELYKALALFDTARRNVLTSGAFVEAVISAGLKLTTVQKAELIKEICRLAAGNRDCFLLLMMSILTMEHL
jgi:hypothetical protein